MAVVTITVILEPNLRREETKRKKEFNLEAWEKETKHNKLKKNNEGREILHNWRNKLETQNSK